MFGEHEAAGAIPVIPTIVVGRSISITEPLLRRSSASLSTRCRLLVHAVVARNATRFCEDRWWRFESSRRYQVFTSRSGDQIGLQIRSRWVQFLGGVRIVRASARAAVWRDSRWISSGLSTRHSLATRSRAIARTPRGVAQIGRALGSGPRGRWFKSTYPDACIGSSVGEHWSQDQTVSIPCPATGRRLMVINLAN